MRSSRYFKCSICGEDHEGLPTDCAYRLPDVVWAIPEADRNQQARFNSDLCQFGERYFIRCILAVPFKELPGEFRWGAWVEVKWPTFERYLQIYEEDGSSEPRHSALLSNDLVAYRDSLDVSVLIQFREASKRPLVSLHGDDEILLAIEQREGITDSRYHEVLDIIQSAKVRDNGLLS